MNKSAPASKTKQKIKDFGFITRIFTIFVFTAAVIISVVFSTMYLQSNGNLSIEFAGGYQTQVKYDGVYDDDSKTQEIVNLLEKRVDPLGTSNVDIEKSTNAGNYFNVSISKTVGINSAIFISNIARRGYVYLLDKDGHDLLANQYDASGKSWKARDKRIVTTKAFSSITQTVNPNSHQPQVSFAISDQDLVTEIQDVLKSDPAEKIYLYSDIGGLLNYVRNTWTGLEELVKYIDQAPAADQDALKVLLANKTSGFNDDTGARMYSAVEGQSKELRNILDQSKNGVNTIDWVYSDNTDKPLSVDTNDENSVFDPTKPFDPTKDNASPMNAWLPGINSLIINKDISDFLNTLIINYKYASYFIGTADNTSINNSTLTINDDTFSQEKVQQIVNVLNAGKEKNNFNVLTILQINPTLGSTALKFALIALLVALVVLSILMMFHYRLLGVIAVLIIIVFLVATLVSFTFLSGIASPEAGIALIISFALLLDVVIGLFNRLQKEHKSGKTIYNAFKDANKKSLSGAFDTNIVVLIVSLTIFWFGTRSIRGFAIMTSLATFGVIVLGIVVLRLALYFLLRNDNFENRPALLGLIANDQERVASKKATPKLVKFNQFKTNISQKLKLNKTSKIFNITQWNCWHKSVKIILISFGVILLASGTTYLAVGANFGQGFDSRIDFTGETSITTDPTDPAFDLAAQIAQARANVVQQLDANKQSYLNVYGAQKLYDLKSGAAMIEIIIQTNISSSQVDAYQQFLHADLSQLQWSYTTNDALSGNQLFKDMLIAIAISLIAIFLYVFIRFQLSFTIPLILSLAIAILMTLAVVSLLHITITTMIIGVVLAVLVLVLINSVVIFDQIKEIKLNNNDKRNELTKQEIIAISNEGVKKSLIRTLSLNSIIILTSLIIVIFVPSFWAVSLSLIIGTIITFIATHFIAPWFWTFFERWRIRNYKKRVVKIKKHFVGPDEYIIKGIND